MALHTNPLNAIVVTVFGDPLAALWISAALLIGCLFIIAYNYRTYHKPLKRNLVVRTKALAFVQQAQSSEDAQIQLAERFVDINAAMMSGDGRAAELRQAWTQFRETILDETEVPLRATARPEGYFLHLGDDTRVLAWWANIFVALGLTFTFLGIVAALTSTVQTLNQGGAGNMTPALIGLLTITSVKFWTSIVGVVASIILRWVDRRWHSGTLRELETICDALEFGTLFSPAQRIAADQLREVREQTATLKTFSHELAAAIGDNLERQMQPMVQVLGGIHSSIDDFKNGSFSQIGKEFGEALSRQAGTEMSQLGAALGEMTTRLSTVHEQLEGSGRAANDQIAQAARDFSDAAIRMNEMFGALNERIEATGARMTDAADGASRAALAQLNDASGGIHTAFGQMRDEVAEYVHQLTVGAETAADRNADVLKKAAAALEGASARAATGMGQALDASIGRASEESAAAITAAFAKFGDRFDQASAGFIESLRSTAGRTDSLSSSIERSTTAADAHAAKLGDAGRQAEVVAGTLSRAAGDMQAAADPIRRASEAIGVAVANTGQALAQQVESASAHRAAMTTISDRLGETTQAATNAWSEYRGRFEDVDKALAKAIEQINAASREHSGHLNEQVGRMDNALAGAVDKLHAALEPLTELAEQIEDLLGRMQARV